jgi:C4-dicarboxylate-specific signal transduction histidine kinase
VSRGRLIIVDDEPVILRLLASIFDDEEYELVTCADGRSAIAAIDEGVDVLLTDKNLPDVGGLELLEHAKRKQPDCEVLIITGYASLETVLRAMHLDAFDYIVKPPKDIFHVKRKVGQAFAKVRLARENRQLLERLRVRNAELESALEELKEVQAELIQSEKLAGIGTLAAGIAHEISSPLFGVMGLAEAIQEEDDRALVDGYAREIVDYSRTIKEIVVQLSGYSRTAEHEYHTTVELSRVVEDAVRLVRRSLQAEPIEVRIDVPDGLFINARTNEVQQVFVNLVKNALEAVAEKAEDQGDDAEPGHLVIRGTLEGDSVQIEVRDTGPGIPPDRVGAIFDPFYTTKPPGRGTGLGLNIVYRIVTKYRGTIAVESIVGSGTAFLLRFPRDTGPDDGDAGTAA